jgi:hypothetical protein
MEQTTKNRGQPVTHYKVKYDRLPSITSGANGGSYGSFSVLSSSIAGVRTFSLTYDGQTTEQLPCNVLAQDMKNALESLCTVEEVFVTFSIHCSPDPHFGCAIPPGNIMPI